MVKILFYECRLIIGLLIILTQKTPTKHSHKGIGNRYSQFKLSEPITWEGLRLCFQDPTSRIRPSVEQPITHPIIEKVSINGGFLSDFNIELNPNLNCFIGGRGTGKSCLLEVLRHTFGVNPKTDQNQSQAKGIIEHTFPAGSKVSVQFRLGPDVVYTVERYSGDSPKVYRYGEQEPLDLVPEDLLPIQVYGQKEIYEISRDPNFQLRLFDNYLEESLHPVKKIEEKIVSALEDNANQISKLTEEIDGINSEVGALGFIAEQIHRIESQDFTAKLQQKSGFDQEKELLELVHTKIDSLKTGLSTFLTKNRLNVDDFEEEKIEKLPNKPLLEQLRIALQEIDNALENNIYSLISQIDTIQIRNSKEINLWEKAFTEQEKTYQELLIEFQTDGTGLEPDRYIKLQKEQRRLQGLSEILDTKVKSLIEIKIKRSDLLSELRRNRRTQFELRQAKANDLTAALERRVRITIWPQGNREEYKKQLSTLFEGTRTRKDVLDELANIGASEPESPAEQPVPYHGETRYLIPEIPLFLDQINLANAIKKRKARHLRGRI